VRHFSSKVANQLLDGLLVAENLDLQRAGFRVPKHEQVLGVDMKKALIPTHIHPLRAQEDPSIHCHVGIYADSPGNCHFPQWFFIFCTCGMTTGSTAAVDSSSDCLAFPISVHFFLSRQVFCS
jgi:hypothetical protein